MATTTTTNKIEKEIKQDVAAMEAAIESLTVTQLEELLKEKKEHEIKKVTDRLKAVQGEADALQAQLVNLGVKPAAPAAAPVKRGRKPRNIGPIGTVSDIPATGTRKATRKGKAKRGAVGEAITAFVASKGKAGAKVSEIAAHLGTKPANVTAFFYAKGNRKKFKKVAPATFALAK